MTEPKTIDQAGMRALIMERLEHPERYAAKPLFVWQGVWSDGLQQWTLLRTCGDFNRACGNRMPQWSIFRMITVRDSDSHLIARDDNFKGRLAGYLIVIRTLAIEDYLPEVNKLIEENHSSLPLIVYLPVRFEQTLADKIDFEGEHRIFAPDFEPWAKGWADPTIPDFIRGDGNEAGITYRWYNLFNDPDKGCAMPIVWDALNHYLNNTVRISRRYKKDFTIRDLDDDFIREAFQVAADSSHGHISDDVIIAFINYIKNDNRDK